MEKRILMAFALSFLVFTLYLRFFSPTPRQPLEPPAAGVEDVQPPPPALPAPLPQAGVGIPEGPPSATPTALTEELRQDTVERTIEVDTPLYHAVFENRGAKLKSFVLKEYTDESGRPFEMVPIEASERLGTVPLELELEDPAWTAAVENALFEASASQLDLTASESGEMIFDWANGQGLSVRKKLGFSGDSYRVQVEVSVQRAGNELGKKILYGPGVGEAFREGTYVQPDRGVIAAGGELEFFSADDIEEAEGAAVGVQLVGISAHYFAGLMVPTESGKYAASLSKESLEVGEEDVRRRDFITAALEAPNAPLLFTLYIGPKEQDRLAELGPGIENVIDYGRWMRYLALPLRSALLWIHGYAGNYGWSIVLLTIAINVVLIPLKHHSYVSMRKMQELAPTIKRIQERYKKLKPTDPRRQEMNKEVYALYREHHVSPLSGCLPMLLMIPFFFAFYRLLMVSIELRHAPFMLWIQDLSSFDPFFVLPILMGVSQIAIQKMSPQTSADPVQAKVMMFMPVVFVFILAWAPSGLVLYWFVNNLVSLVQQSVTNRLRNSESTGGKKTKKGSGQPKNVEA